MRCSVARDFSLVPRPELRRSCPAGDNNRIRGRSVATNLKNGLPRNTEIRYEVEPNRAELNTKLCCRSLVFRSPPPLAPPPPPPESPSAPPSTRYVRFRAVLVPFSLFLVLAASPGILYNDVACTVKSKIARGLTPRTSKTCRTLVPKCARPEF